MAELTALPVKLLVVGSDDRRPFEILAEQLAVARRVQFLRPSKDVIQFYAAADAYIGPSLYDPFAMPPSEAMACGLPVITSSTNGGSEMITDQVDGLILRDAKDSHVLTDMIKRLYHDGDLRRRLGENAVRTAGQYTWERNADEMRRLFEQAMGARTH
jgi:UDP-glucose:(heptosyl)LPS alpha-1,3-glucosyltransferase